MSIQRWANNSLKVLGALAVGIFCSSLQAKNRPATPYSPPTSPTNSPVVRIGVLPNENTPAAQEIRDQIGTLTGFKVTLQPAASYDEIIQMFSKNKIDFAWFSSFPFVLAEQTAKPKVLFKKKYGRRSFYHASIVTKSDKSITSLAGLEGKKIAVADTKSTSGFLFPNLLIHRQTGKKMDSLATVVVAGTHQAALQKLVAGQADAAAVWSDDPQGQTGAWNQLLPPAESKLLKSIATTPAIPNDPFCVREQFYVDNPLVVLKVMEVMYKIAETPLFKKAFHADGIEMAIPGEYDIVREAAKLL